jgi:hypothetical protein
MISDQVNVVWGKGTQSYAEDIRVTQSQNLCVTLRFS